MRATGFHVPFRVSCLVTSFLVFLLLLAGVAAAQGHRAVPERATAAEQPAGAARESQQSGINQQFGSTLAEQSAAAAHEKENSQEKMVEEMKESPSVQSLAKLLHISPQAGYWAGIVIDFAILALLIIFALKKNLPAMFQSRTASIRQGIDEARKASEEANRRLADVEARLAKMDQEIGAMRAAAEQEAAAEEQRILAAAEEDKQRIVQAAEAEIVAAARLARRELKSYAAELAVSLAERRIHVDAAVDQALVRSFTSQLGDSAGKDGQ